LEKESEDILDLTKEWAVKREEEEIRREEKKGKGREKRERKKRKRKGKEKKKGKKKRKEREKWIIFLKRIWLTNYIVEIILGNENKMW
jgi:hypothetical protein